MTPPVGPEVLVVDMTRCDGHGICAFVHPDRIRLDAWGFPLVDGSQIVDRREARAARRAVRACPKRALSVVAAPMPAHAHTVKP